MWEKANSFNDMLNCFRVGSCQLPVSWKVCKIIAFNDRHFAVRIELKIRIRLLIRTPIVVLLRF